MIIFVRTKIFRVWGMMEGVHTLIITLPKYQITFNYREKNNESITKVEYTIVKILANEPLVAFLVLSAFGLGCYFFDIFSVFIHY